MTVITAAHRARMKLLHERDPEFGVIGHLWSHRVVAFIRELDCRSYLDYGAGRSGLSEAVGSDLHALRYACMVAKYEPAFGHKAPESSAFVSCIDVLEHVEKECLEAVLFDLRRCTLTAALITISLRNAANRLNHPIVRPRGWWVEQISTRFAHIQEVPILDPEKAKSELAIIARR